MKKTQAFIISAILLFFVSLGIFLLINPMAVYRIIHFGWIIAFFIIAAIVLCTATYIAVNDEAIDTPLSTVFYLLSVLLIPLMIVGVTTSQNTVYEIYTPRDMQVFGNAPINQNTAFILQDDIDFTNYDVSGWYGKRKSFEGVFEGNGYTFSNINAENTDIKIEYGSSKGRAIGFVGVNFGTIRNLNFENCRFSAHFKSREYFEDKYFGVIAAVNFGGKIYDCNVIECQARYIAEDGKEVSHSLSVGLNSKTSYYGTADKSLIRVNVINDNPIDETFYKQSGIKWKKIGVDEKKDDK